MTAHHAAVEVFKAARLLARRELLKPAASQTWRLWRDVNMRSRRTSAGSRSRALPSARFERVHATQVGELARSCERLRQTRGPRLLLEERDLQLS